ncbi:MAG TPA: GLPGLI family protein [Tenuifilaceae bacterium]|nr:GLPGLI family protein [Bacteroidales bacterium]HNV81974.1 GLPGLI family protein [Tenuifilaceae bacterium]HPW49938.1 GLPGLI family protein [Tenuifilaceae bacterium]
MRALLFLTILTIASCTIIYGQHNGRIFYICEWELTEAQGVLCFSGEKSSFLAISDFTLKENQKNEEIAVDSIDFGNLKMVLREDGSYHGKIDNRPKTTAPNRSPVNPFNIYTDISKEKIYKEIYDDRLFKLMDTSEFIVFERFGSIQWRILDEQKQIGNFNCQKAEGKFRGREYTVWFSTDIPNQYGPWKLNGLPGLILEASDSKNEVHFYATEVQIGKDICDPAPLVRKGHALLELSEYIALTDLFLNAISEEYSRLFQSRAPEGVVGNFKISRVNMGLELDYEFSKR